MSQDIINAAILALRSKGLESYGVIKGILQRSPKEGDVEEIARMSLKLVQYEGAMLTLQQYAEELLTTAPNEDPTLPEEAEEDAPIVVTPENSPTMRRAMEAEARKRGSDE